MSRFYTISTFHTIVA